MEPGLISRTPAVKDPEMSSILQKLLILTIPLGIVVFVIEIFLRTVMPIYGVGNIYWLKYDETNGVAFKPSMHAFESNDYQSEMRTNSMATVNFQEAFDDYEQLVFAVGDSYTQGVGVPSDAAFPFQLDLLLNLDGMEYHRRYGVVNLGFFGYGAFQSINRMQNFADEIGEPDYILFFGSSNDHRDDQLFESGYRHQHLVPGNPRFGIFARPLIYLANEVQLLVRLKIALSVIRQGRLLGDGDENPIVAAAEGGKGKNVALLQEARFEEIYELAQQYGAQLIVGWTDVEGSDSASYQWLREWADGRGVGFADWLPAVAAVRERMPDLPVNNNHSGGHHRTWVNRMIAEAYAREMSKFPVTASDAEN